MEVKVEGNLIWFGINGIQLVNNTYYDVISYLNDKKANLTDVKSYLDLLKLEGQTILERFK